jgi:hypothetical protein
MLWLAQNCSKSCSERVTDRLFSHCWFAAFKRCVELPLEQPDERRLDRGERQHLVDDAIDERLRPSGWEPAPYSYRSSFLDVRFFKIRPRHRLCSQIEGDG